MTEGITFYTRFQTQFLYVVERLVAFAEGVSAVNAVVNDVVSLKTDKIH